MEPTPVELDVARWVNGPPVDMRDLRGRVVLIEAFQMLCPGCVGHGLPQARRVKDAFDPQEVAVIGLHTVFEHHAVMGPEALAVFVSEYGIDFPVAIDRPVDGSPIPATMARYQLRGTPSTLLVDRAGHARHVLFGAPDDLVLGAFLGRLLAESAPERDENTPGHDAVPPLPPRPFTHHRRRHAMSTSIPGYTHDAPDLAPSPVTPAEFTQLQQSVLWSDADRDALRRAAEILVPQTDAILDLWYGFVGGTPHLVATFMGAGGQPDGDYLARVRSRFGQWIADLTRRDYDERWLAYQEEIGLRHHTARKNRVDEVDSPSTHVPLRHLIALIVPITVTIRDFLANGESDPASVDAMYQAWFKAVTASVALWARPYAPDTW